MSENANYILVVEDDREINTLVGAYAELCSFGYRGALSGEQAFRALQEKLPALVVLDLMLPDTDGFEVCRRIKAEVKTREIPVIMLTALSGEQDRRHGLECGAVEYLNKPFNPETLMNAMKRHAKPVETAK